MAGSRLGEMLVKGKLITEDQLKTAVNIQKSVGGRLSAILVKLGFISDANLTSFIAKKQGLDVAELKDLVIPENLIKKVPRKLIEEYNVIPIAFKDGVLTVATSDPTDFEAVEAVQLATNYRIEVALATKTSISQVIQQIFASSDMGEHKSKEDLLKDLTEAPARREVQARAKQAEDQAHGQMLLRKALIPLLVEKGIITEEELIRKAREIEQKEKEA